jgi:hypothetical protein
MSTLKGTTGGRRRRAAPKRKRAVKRKVGGNKFTDFFTKTIPGAAKTVYNKAIKPAANFVKKNHIISSVTGLIPSPAGKVAAIGLRAVGLGRKRRVRKATVPRATVGGRRRRVVGGAATAGPNGQMWLV